MLPSTRALVAMVLCAGMAVGDVAASEPVANDDVWSAEQHAVAELLTAFNGVAPGSSVLIGIRIRIQPDWHVYWRHPGESGMPTSIAWDLPDGVMAGPLLWPAPEVFREAGVTYGYHGDVLLLTMISVPSDAAIGETIPVRGHLRWLACTADVCVPGNQDVALELPVVAEPVASLAMPVVATTLTDLPRRLDADVTARLHPESGHYEVTLPVAGQFVRFLPYDDLVIDHQADQLGTREGRLRIDIPPSTITSQRPERLRGVVLLADGPAIEIDLPLERPRP